MATIIFFFQALNFLVESFGLLNDLFPFPLILDVGYTVFGLQLADVLFEVILPFTGCPRRNVPYFGRVFLILKYTDITPKKPTSIVERLRR
jgi:hypothetical protein